MGKSAVIIGDGEFPRKEYPLYVLHSADYVVCCDGAFRKYMRRTGGDRLPDAVVGDMDSLSAGLQKKYAGLIVHVSEQDDNDQTKTFRYVLEHFRDVSEIHILGGTGMREDHTIGNISLLMEYARTFDLGGIGVDMISDYSTIFAITDSTELEVGEGRRISIITPDPGLRIDSEGLEWPTSGVVFDNWWKSTLNRACSDRVRLTFSHPSMAIVILD